MPNIPILALTATLTIDVLQCLAAQFNMSCPIDGQGIIFIFISLLIILMLIIIATISKGKTSHFYYLKANKYL